MKIRVARQADADELTRLCLQLGYGVSADEMHKRLAAGLASSRRYLAVAQGSQSGLLGWIEAEHRNSLEAGERVEIIGLVVDAAARRQGIGNLLVAAAEAWTIEIGLSTLIVRSNTTRSESHPFYEGIGYARRKTQHMYSRHLDAKHEVATARGTDFDRRNRSSPKSTD